MAATAQAPSSGGTQPPRPPTTAIARCVCFVGNRTWFSLSPFIQDSKCSAGGWGILCFMFPERASRAAMLYRVVSAVDTNALCAERKFIFWHWLTHHCDFPEPEKVKSRFRWPILYSPFVSRRAPEGSRTDRNSNYGGLLTRCAENQSGKIVATYNCQFFCTP